MLLLSGMPGFPGYESVKALSKVPAGDERKRAVKNRFMSQQREHLAPELRPICSGIPADPVPQRNASCWSPPMQWLAGRSGPAYPGVFLFLPDRSQ